MLCPSAEQTFLGWGEEEVMERQGGETGFKQCRVEQILSFKQSQ